VDRARAIPAGWRVSCRSATASEPYPNPSSREVGQTQSFISEIERGLRRVDVLEIILIARGLRANPLKLFAEIARSAAPA
jgi:isocitrate lyase